MRRIELTWKDFPICLLLAQIPYILYNYILPDIIWYIEIPLYTLLGALSMALVIYVYSHIKVYIQPKLKIEFAPRTKLSKLECIESIFLEDILGHPEAFISDESKLNCFIPIYMNASEKSAYITTIIVKCKSIFKVDISPVINDYLSTIFEYIEANEEKKEQS